LTEYGFSSGTEQEQIEFQKQVVVRRLSLLNTLYLKGLIVEGLVTLYSLGWINNLGLRDTLLSVRFHFLFISPRLFNDSD